MAYKDKLPILKNFVEMGITQDVSSVDTTIYVSNASLFPSVVPGADYIPCVIRWSGSTREIVHVTAVNTSANTITVERGQEGTAAQSHPHRAGTGGSPEQHLDPMPPERRKRCRDNRGIRYLFLSSGRLDGLS